MNKYKKLAFNSFIFTIGNMGSKLISLFLVPLYTYYLTSGEYGTVDLISTTMSLLIPIFTVSIFDAVLRFVMDKNENPKIILNNALLVTLLGVIFAFLLYPIFKILLPFPNLMNYFYLFLLTQAINSTFLQFIRAIGKVKLFAGMGIVSALVISCSNIILIVILKLGSTGYLVSLILSDIVILTIMLFFGEIYKYISFKNFNWNLMKKMMFYSLPLIPNALMWWVMGVVDRYFITFYLGLASNGLYAVANKVPNLLSMVNSIFFQAWQMSAIEEANDDNKNKFFTTVFDVFSTSMIIASSILLVILKPLISTVISQEYFISWEYVPFLLLGVVFSSFSGFLGTNYIANKNTKGVFKTSVIGAIINVIGNVILIPRTGVNGASISTMISFFIVWIIRIFDTKKYVIIHINFWKMIINFGVLFVQISNLYMNYSYQIIINIILFFVLIIINRRVLLILIVKIIEVFRQKIKMRT